MKKRVLSVLILMVILNVLILMVILSGCSGPAPETYKKANEPPSPETTLEYVNYLFSRESISPAESSLVSAIYLRNIFEEEKKQTELLQRIVDENK